MNVSDITKYLNIVLIVLFVVVLVALVLFFLRGLARGWRYGTYRVIAFAVLFIICFTTLGVIADAVGNWDMTSFAIPKISIPLNDGNRSGSAVLEFGTPYSAISNAIADALKFYNVSMAPEDLAAYANALAKSIVMLLLVSIEGSLLATLGNLIVLLLWHIAFKHIIPPDRRKESYKKGKLISAFEELVIGIVIGAMFLFPLTSMVNSFAYGWNKVSDEEKASLRADNKTYDTIQTVVDTYNDSLFSKVFFSWTKDSNDSSFDMTLTKFLTKGSYDQKEVSVINEFSSLAKISSLAIEGGLISEKGFDQSKVAFFAVSEYAPLVLKALAQSDLITGIIPYALDIITNMDTVAPYIKTQTGIDFSDSKYKYSLTLNKLADLYQGIVADKVLTSAVIGADGKLGATSDIVQAAFSSDSQTPMEDLLKALDSEDLAILDTLIESAVYVMCCSDAAKAKADPTSAAKTIGISDFFPEITAADDLVAGATPKEVPESFSSIKWGEQLAIVYDSVCRIAQKDTKLIPALTKNLGTSSYSIDIKSLLPGIIDNLSTYGSALYGGDSVAAAESTSTTSSGASTTTSYLLDCSFLENAMPKVFTILQDSLNESFGFTGNDALSLDSVKTALFVSDPAERRSNVKTEFSNLFKVLSDIASTEEGKNLLKDLDGLPGIYFDPDGHYIGMDKNLLSGFTNGVKALDSSKIASAILPKVFEGFLKGDASPLKSLGFDTNKSTTTSDDDITLDFSTNVGTNLANLISVYTVNQDVVSYLMSNSTGITAGNADTVLRSILSFKDSENKSQIGNLLKALITNPLINPTGSNNRNITVLLNVLLKQTMSTSSSSVSYFSDLANAIDGLDNDGLSKEINSFVNALETISSEGVLSTIASFSSSSTPNIASLKSIKFETLFTTFNTSRILKSILGTLLDNAILPNVQYLSDASSYGISFKNVTDWGAEGKALDALVAAAADIGDLSNIDYFHSDPTAIKSILKALAGSGIFNKKDAGGTISYVFPSYIANKMVTYFQSTSGQSVAAYFADAGTDGTAANPYKYTRFTDDFKSLATSSEWTEDGGEADKISAILVYVSRLNGFNTISSDTDWRNVNPSDLSGLLDAVTASESFGPILTYHLYEKVASTLGSSEKAFNASNLDYLLDTSLTSAQRETEAAYLADILKAAIDPVYGLLDSNGKLQQVDIKLQDVSADFFVNPLLTGMASSNVFNTLSAKADPDTNLPYTMTAFEKEYLAILVKANLYTGATATADATNAILSVRGADQAATIADWKVEIDHLCTLLSDVKALNLDVSALDFSTLFSPNDSAELNESNRKQVEETLASYNACKTLYASLPGQLKQAVSSINGVSSYGLDQANFDYNNGQPYDASEIAILSYIMEDGYLCGFTNLSVSSVSSNSYLSTLLEKLAASKVFNTTKDTTVGAMTAFETTMDKVLLDSGYYGDKTDATVQANVKTVVLDVKYSAGWSGTTGEVKKLEAVAGSIPTDTANKEIDLGTFDLSSYFGNDATTKESQRAKLQTFLDNVNKSGLLYPGFAAKVASSVSTIKTGAISLSGANSYYNGYFQYHDLTTPTTLLTHTSLGAAYNDTSADPELKTLSYIFMNASGLDSIDFNDLSSIDAAQTTNLLVNLTESNVFNTLEQNAAAGTLTVAQNVISQALLAGGSLNDIYYYASNPKDIALNKAVSTIIDSSSKADYIAKSYFAKSVAANHSGLLNGDTGSLKSLLTTLQRNSSLADAVKNGATTGLSETQMAKLLKALNACELYQDCVPNTLAKFLSGTSLSIDGINFNRADPYYCYYWSSTSDTINLSITNPDFTVNYDKRNEGEIDRLATILSLVSENKTLLSGLTATPITDDSVISDVIKPLLLNLSESYVFHKGLAYQGSHSLLPATSTTYGLYDDLTVFEQMIFMIYDQSSLAKQAYDISYDNSYLVIAQSNGTDAYKEKLYDFITKFNAKTLTNVSHVGNWDDEIAALTTTNETGVGQCGLLQLAYDYGFLSTGVSGMKNTTSFQSLPPDKIEAVALALNRLDIVKDTVPYSVAGLIEDSLGFARYSEIEESAILLSGTTSYRSQDVLGNIGHIEQITITSASAPEVKISFDGTSYVKLTTSSTSSPYILDNDGIGTLSVNGNVYTYSIDNLYPLYYEVSSASEITALSTKFNTSDYLLDQTDYAKDGVGILKSFASAIWNPTTGEYLKFTDQSTVSTYLVGSDSTKLQAFLDFISSDTGFYTRRFYGNGGTSDQLVSIHAEKASSLFASRDITISKLMNFSTTVGVTTVAVSLGKYLGKDQAGIHKDLAIYEGAESIFAAANYNSAKESVWLKANLMNVISAEAAYTNAVDTTLSYGANTYIVPRVHMIKETFLNSATSATYTAFKAAVPAGFSADSEGYLSGFGHALSAGLIDEFIATEYRYGASGSYFTSLSAALPSSAGTSRLSYLSNPACPNLYGASSVSEELGIIDDIVNASASLLLSKIPTSGMNLSVADQASVATTLADLDTKLLSASAAGKLLAHILYLGTYYDYFVNRNFFHGTALVSSSPINTYAYECDFPNPLGNGYAKGGVGTDAAGKGTSLAFSFANVAAQIVTA